MLLGFASVIAVTLSLIVYLSISIQLAALTFIAEALGLGGLIIGERSDRTHSGRLLRFLPMLLVATGGILSTYGNLNCWITCADSNWRMAALVPAFGILLVIFGIILVAYVTKPRDYRESHIK